MVPAVLPLPVLAGNGDCLRLGENFASAVKWPQVDDGFPLACYSPRPDLDPTWHHAASIWRCPVQKFYAQIIELMYDQNWGLAVVRCQVWFSDAAQIFVHLPEGNFPGVITAIGPNWGAAIVHGTINYQQLALQAFYSLAGPVSFGVLSTNVLWWQSAQRLIAILQNDGWIPGNALMLAGHSYGGACVNVASAVLRAASADLPVRYITYGAPKSGDARLKALLAQCQGLDLANTNDFVTILPPDLSLLAPVIPALGYYWLPLFAEWFNSPNTTLQEQDGTLHVNTYPVISTSLLISFIETAVAEGSLFGFPAHTIQSYLHRISARCPGGITPAAGNVVLNVPPRPRAGLGLGVVEVRGELALAPPSHWPRGALGFSPAEGVPDLVPRLGLSSDIVSAGKLALAPFFPDLCFTGLTSLPSPRAGLGMGTPRSSSGAIGYAGGPAVPQYIWSEDRAAGGGTMVKVLSFFGGVRSLVVVTVSSSPSLANVETLQAGFISPVATVSGAAEMGLTALVAVYTWSSPFPLDRVRIAPNATDFCTWLWLAWSGPSSSIATGTNYTASPPGTTQLSSPAPVASIFCPFIAWPVLYGMGVPSSPSFYRLSYSVSTNEDAAGYGWQIFGAWNVLGSGALGPITINYGGPAPPFEFGIQLAVGV
jgi:hypothetical protein